MYLPSVTHKTKGIGILIHDNRTSGHPNVTVLFGNVQQTFFDEEIKDLEFEQNDKELDHDNT